MCTQCVVVEVHAYPTGLLIYTYIATYTTHILNTSFNASIVFYYAITIKEYAGCYLA
jgi:hypothetical protein